MYYNREITPQEYRCLTDMGIQYKKPVRQYELLGVVRGVFDER